MGWSGPARIDTEPQAWLRARGEVFATFDARTQDSGNVSFGVRIDGERFFVKTAGDPRSDEPRAFAKRVATLRNAVEVAHSLDHPLLPALRAVIESPAGPLLAFDWCDGELLRAPPERRQDPTHAFQRFRALEPARIATALDALYDLHAALSAQGWIAVDLYDGSLIWDFERDALHVCDLDAYARGPFANRFGRMWGSSRFMAPEEFERGAHIDQRTNVFVLGRFAAVLLADGSLERAPFRGSDAQHAVLVRACAAEPAARFESVAAFAAAWRGAARA